MIKDYSQFSKISKTFNFSTRTCKPSFAFLCNIKCSRKVMGIKSKYTFTLTNFVARHLFLNSHRYFHLMKPDLVIMQLVFVGFRAILQIKWQASRQWRCFQIIGKYVLIRCSFNSSPTYSRILLGNCFLTCSFSCV